MSYRCIAWFVWFRMSLGKAVVFPDAFYLINQSASWGLRWTLSFDLSKHNLTYCNVEYSKPEVLNFWWTETAFKILIVSLYSSKAAKSWALRAALKVHPVLFPETGAQPRTRAGDKAGWAAKSLNSLRSHFKSHTFSTISPSARIAAFTCGIHITGSWWIWRFEYFERL